MTREVTVDSDGYNLRITDCVDHTVHSGRRELVSYHLGDLEDVITTCDINATQKSTRYTWAKSEQAVTVTCLLCIAEEPVDASA